MFVPPKTILVPTDFSKFSNNALRYGLDIAARYHAKIFLVHVLAPKVYSDHTITVEMASDLKKQRLDGAARRLREEIENLPERGAVEIEPVVRSGVAYEEIRLLEDNLKADLIVIASHGQTGLTSLLTGSVTEKVARNAVCPVLIVRIQEKDSA